MVSQKSKDRHAVVAWLSPSEFIFLDKQLRAADPSRRLGFAKGRILKAFCKSIIIAMHRPNHYSLGEMVYRMCAAAVPSDDQEGQSQIKEILYASR